MTKRFKRIGKGMQVFAIILLITALTLAGCSSTGNKETNQESEVDASSSENTDTNDEAAGETEYGGTLRIATTTEPVNLGFPPDIRQLQERITGKTVMESLGEYDSEGYLQPLLAESWSEDHENNVITFKLKKGIEFHDGTPFNADAVKWNLDQWRVSGKPVFNEEDTESIEVMDEYTVQINLSQWRKSALEVAGTVNMISPTSYEENGIDWVKDNPVGTGPFKFESWDKGSMMRFTKNDDYWVEGQPYLDAIEWHFFKDSMTAEVATLAGDFDVYFNTPVEVAQNMENAGFEVVPLKTGMGAAGKSIIPDSAHPDSPFADIKVREALNYAVDRQAIVDSIYNGYHTVTNQWAVPGVWTYNEDMTDWAFDPGRARELLEEAGYPDGFETTLSYNTSPENDRLFTAIQGYLGDVGIDVQLNPVDTGRFQQLSGDEGWDGLIGANFRVDGDVPLHMNVFMGSEGFLYRDSYVPEALDAKLDEAQSVKTMEERVAVTQELQKMAFEEYMLHINLFVSSMTTVKDPSLKHDGFNQTYADMWTPATAIIEE